MFRSHRSGLLLVSAFVLGGLHLTAQSRPVVQGASHLEVALDYNPARANTVPAYSFWMQGGSMQVCGQITQHWGAVADISGLHNAVTPHANTGLDLVTAVFGPRYTLAAPNGHYRIYGQAMGGLSSGLNSVFPGTKGTTNSANSSAVLVGGGADYRFGRRLAYRIVDAAWLRTEFANGTTNVQNDFRIGTGIVLRF